MRSRAAAAFGLAVFAASAVAGCGPTHSRSSPGAQGGPSTVSPPAAQCGTVHTAAGVPVQIDVQTGPTACRAAMAVERAYAQAVASGKVPGNGGGAPVKIKGWICQGFNTPQVLATGHASACKKHGNEILAILPTPSPSPT
jgi:hypothetical protein